MTPSIDIDIDILNRLRRCVPRLTPLLQENLPLRQLALDSMDTVELLCAVHVEFGVTLTQEEFQPQFCLRDIAQTIALKTQLCPL